MSWSLNASLCVLVIAAAIWLVIQALAVLASIGQADDEDEDDANTKAIGFMHPDTPPAWDGDDEENDE